jgi:hypothetical protein
MNKAQKRLLINLLGTIVVIIIFIFAFGNFKDYVNKVEAMRAFNQLGQNILEYRKQHGLLPSQSSIEKLKEELEGSARVGDIYYRAQWISIDSPPETIVAYAQKEYNWFVSSGFIVLRLDGQVQYLPSEEFRKLLAKQQTMAEAKEMGKTQKSGSEF